MHTCILPLHFDVSLFVFACNFQILNDLSFIIPIVIKMLYIYVIKKNKERKNIKKQKEPWCMGKFRAPAPGKTQLLSAPVPALGPCKKKKKAPKC